MTLGQRIQELRKQHNLSQEALAEKINVSRQAVSKWEAGLSNPDTDNIILLCELFGVSMNELVSIKSESKTKKEGEKAKTVQRIIAVFISIIIAGTALLFVVLKNDRIKKIDVLANKTIMENIGECAFIWTPDGVQKQVLKLGTQEGAFPWGTSFSGEHSFFMSGDFPGVEFHTVDCREIVLSYRYIIESGKNVLASMHTTSSRFQTPRGISINCTESDLIAAYGDELLIMPKAISSIDHFCMYNSLYAYTKGDENYSSIVFYLQNGNISGIEICLANDGGPAYFIDNINTFPLRNGVPDYSMKQEPELETLTKEREVFVALHTLKNYKMDEKDAFPYRNTIFTGLRFIDWNTYGKLGEAGKESETIMELFYWIDAQKNLTNNEICGLQLGLLSNMDGAYTDLYSSILLKTFIQYPQIFLECLAYDLVNYENSSNVVKMTVYSATATQQKIESVKNILLEVINSNQLSDEALLWSKRMSELCENNYGTN